MKKATYILGSSILCTLLMANASALQIYWQKGADYHKIPYNSFNVGHSAEDQPYYACRTFIKDALVPGRITRNYSGCQASYKSTIYYAPSYSVLAMNYDRGDANGYHWRRAYHGHIPRHSLIVGHQAHGNPYFLCRGELKHGLRNGKIAHGYSGCQVNYENRAYYLNQYSVLKLRYS